MEHPGKLLMADMRERNISAAELSRQSGITPVSIGDILRGYRGIGPGTARKLQAAGFRTAEEWMRLQSAWALAQSFEREGIR